MPSALPAPPVRPPDPTVVRAGAGGGADARAMRRLAWPDVAKGACILLVVLWHVVLKHYQQIDWDVRLPVVGAWGVLNEQLMPLRMPLFFTVSGLFAVRAVEGPWPDLLRSRIGRFAALYLMWVLIETLVLRLAPSFPTARAEDPLQLLAELTVSPTNLWYLLALALYFAVAKSCRRVPTPWLLGAATVLSAAAAAHLIPSTNNRWQVLQNLLFFLAGLRLAPHVTAFAAATGRRRLLLIGVGTLAAVASVSALHAQAWLGVWPAVSVLAAITGVGAAAAVTRRLPRIAAPLAALGRRTLPVYVLHLPLLAVLDALLHGPLQRLGSHSTALAAVEPIMATATVVAVSLLVHLLLQRMGLGRLFDPLRMRSGSAGER